jgi:zinc protease
MMNPRFFNFFIPFAAFFLSQSSHAIQIAFEQDSGLPTVYINVAVKAGTVTDPEGQSGLTNFMGEMLIRGTKTRTKEQLDLALDQMGAKLDVETRAEALIFRGAVLSSQLNAFLDLLKEILTQPSLPEGEIKKLKAEVVSVLQEELGHDSSLASRRFTRFLFQGHPYGKPIMGRIKDIESLTREQVLAHYHRLIQDQTLLVVGSGDASESKISDWAKNIAESRPNLKLSSSDEKILSQVKTPQNPEARRLLIIDKPERTQTQINFGQIGIRMTGDDFFPLHLGNYAFGGPSFSAVLMTEIRVKRGWSYGANSAFRYGLQPRSWQVHLFPAAKDTPDALAYSLKLVSDLQKNGIPQERFDFAKRSLVNSAGFIYNTPKKRVENTLLEKTLDLPDGFMKSFGPQIEKLSLSEVNEALKNFLKPDRVSIAVLGTAKSLKEPLAKAAGVPLEQVEVIPYTAD